MVGSGAWSGSRRGMGRQIVGHVRGRVCGAPTLRISGSQTTQTHTRGRVCGAGVLSTSPCLGVSMYLATTECACGLGAQGSRAGGARGASSSCRYLMCAGPTVHTGRVRWQRVPCGRLGVLTSRAGGMGGVLGRACAALSALLPSAPRLPPARAFFLPVAVALGAVARAGGAALWPLLVAAVSPAAAA